MRSYKILCNLGQQLEKAWDDALKQYRKTSTEENKDKLFDAVKAYFFHRQNCLDCRVIWRKNEQ